MKRLASVFFGLFLLAIIPAFALAVPLTAYVEPFKVVGGAADPNLSATLQSLLSSRLSGEALLVQDAPAGAQVLIKGSYIQFGRVFSIDVAARDQAGKVLARAYEQGEGEEGLPTALAKLAEKLTGFLAPARPAAPTVAAPAPAVQTAPPATVAAPTPAPSAPSRESDIIRTAPVDRSGSAGVVSERLVGAYIGMAPLRTSAGGERELFLLGEGSLHVVRHGAKTEQLAKATLDPDEKALTVDTADLDGDGVPEAYLTVVRGVELASQVWVFRDNRLVRIADDLPYFFRTLAAPDGKGKLYAQEMGRSEDFYGPVFELKKGAKGFERQNPIKLPRFAHLFNFNRFTDRDGIGRIVVLHPDGFLVVYADSGEELWRSNDKYGGSEVYFNRDDSQNMRTTGTAFRKVFLDQRITVAANGEIIVPQNTGFWVVGNSRSFSKNSVLAFAWNGVALDERWHTKTSQNYLADYYLDEERKELVLLEVVKKAGVVEQGASAIYIKKVE